MSTSTHRRGGEPVLSLLHKQKHVRHRVPRAIEANLMPVPDVSIPVSLGASSAGADRLLSSIARGNRCFVLTSADGDVAVRINVVIDRRTTTSELVSQLGDLVIDWEQATIERKGKCALLSRTELRLLSCLLDAHGEVVSRERLIASAWAGVALEDRHNALAVYVCYLRRRLKAVGLGTALRTVRGAGYVLDVG